METLSVRPFVGSLNVSHHRLPNGLEVLVLDDPAAPVVTYHTWFKVGSSDEREGITGIAHLFEHMMFKETTEYPDGYWSRQVEEAGSPDNNAFTWVDETVYTQSVPKERLELIARLESIRMTRLVVDSKQLEAEREVVLNERRFRSEDDPYGRISEAIYASAFEVHPYRWPTIGWRKDVERITVEDAVAFYRSFYAPNNATLVIAGDVRAEEALSLVERFYGGIAPSDPKRPEKPEEPEQRAARRVPLALQLESEVVDIGFKVPGFRHRDSTALSVLDAVLSTGRSSPLQRRLVDAGLCASASSSQPPFEHPCLFEFSATMRDGKAAATAEAVIRDILDGLARDGVAEADLDRARNHVLKASWEALESAAGKADLLGWYQVIGGDWREGLARLDRVREVTADDLSRVVSEYFRPERSTTVVAWPQGKRARIGARALPAAPAAPPPGPALPAPRADEATGPPRPVEVIDLPSGVKVVTSFDPSLPVIDFQVAFTAGTRMDPEGMEGLCAFAAESVLRGTRRRGREQFESDLERLGASLDVSAGSDHVVFAGSTLTRSWPALVELFAEALAEPSFDRKEFKLLKEETLAHLEEERNDDRSLAAARFRREVYGAHPYARDPRGRLSTVPRLRPRDAEAFFHERLKGTATVVGLGGRLQAECVADIGRIVGSLPCSGGPPAGPCAPGRLPGRRLVIVDKPERSQTQIYLGHPSVAVGDPRHPAFAVGNNAFGGYNFTTRLMEEVRVKRGWSYGAYGSLRQGKFGGSYSIWVFPAEDQAADCLGLVLDLFAQVARDGLRDDEIAFGRNALVNTAPFLRDTASKRLGIRVSELLTGFDPVRALDQARHVSAAEVNRALAELYDPDRVVAVVVGTASRIRDALVKRTGIEDVTVVPYDAE